MSTDDRTYLPTLAEALRQRDEARAIVDRIKALHRPVYSPMARADLCPECSTTPCETWASTAAAPHRCTSDGNGRCKRCGAEEPPPWPPSSRAAIEETR